MVQKNYPVSALKMEFGEYGVWASVGPAKYEHTRNWKQGGH